MIYLRRMATLKETSRVSLRIPAARQQATLTKKGRSKVIAATSYGHDPPSCNLYVSDVQRRRRFIIDNFADVSVIPPTHEERRFPPPSRKRVHDQHIRSPHS